MSQQEFTFTDQVIDSSANNILKNHLLPASLYIVPFLKNQKQNNISLLIMVPPRAPAPAARPQTNASGSYQIPVARSTEGSNGKPKARPKTGADFSAFFAESEAKRAAS